MVSDTPGSDARNLAEASRDSPGVGSERPPHRVRLPGFVHEEIGLGDVIKRVTYATGIRPCTGCQRRAAALNRWLVFSPILRR